MSDRVLPEGLEPSAVPVEAGRSHPLSYGSKCPIEESNLVTQLRKPQAPESTGQGGIERAATVTRTRISRLQGDSSALSYGGARSRVAVAESGTFDHSRTGRGLCH